MKNVKYKIIAFMSILIMMVHTLSYNDNVEAGVIDTIRNGFGLASESDFWSGLLGYYTNCFGYVTGRKNKQEYKEWCDNFARYISSYSVDNENSVQFDSSTGNITIDKELQKEIINYINQDSVNGGFVKITGNPASSAKMYSLANSKFSSENFNKFQNIWNGLDSSKLYILKVTFLESFPFQALYKTTDLSSISDVENNTILLKGYHSRYDYMTGQEILNLIYGNAKSDTDYVTVETNTRGCDGTIYYLSENNTVSESRMDFTLRNRYDDSELDTYSTFFGSGTYFAYINSIPHWMGNDYIDLPYPGESYKQNPLNVYQMPIEKVIYGDHYTVYEDNRTIVNNYCDGEHLYTEPGDQLTNDDDYPEVEHTPVTPTPTPGDDDDNIKFDPIKDGRSSIRNLKKYFLNILTVFNDIFTVIPDFVWDTVSFIVEVFAVVIIVKLILKIL